MHTHGYVWVCICACRIHHTPCHFTVPLKLPRALSVLDKLHSPSAPLLSIRLAGFKNLEILSKPDVFEKYFSPMKTSLRPSSTVHETSFFCVTHRHWGERSKRGVGSACYKSGLPSQKLWSSDPFAWQWTTYRVKRGAWSSPGVIYKSAFLLPPAGFSSIPNLTSGEQRGCVWPRDPLPRSSLWRDPPRIENQSLAGESSGHGLVRNQRKGESTLYRCRPPPSVCTACTPRSNTSEPGTGRAASLPGSGCCGPGRSRWRRSFCPCSICGLMSPASTCWGGRSWGSPRCGRDP